MFHIQKAERISPLTKDIYDILNGIVNYNITVSNAETLSITSTIYNNIDIIIMILCQRPSLKNVGIMSSNILMFAVNSGDVRILSKLLDNGIDPNTANEMGVTPLMIASSNDDVCSIDELLTAGADTDAVDKKFKSALHYGIEYKSTKAFKYLEQYIMDLYELNNDYRGIVKTTPHM